VQVQVLLMMAVVVQWSAAPEAAVLRTERQRQQQHQCAMCSGFCE
jgi:hypothetical protein